jgi:hypothetical protein
MAKRGLLDHEKTINLAETLKIMDVYALGILEAFFQWTAKYHPTGDVSGSKARVFARTIRYNKVSYDSQTREYSQFSSSP